MAENTKNNDWKEREIGALWKKIKDGKVSCLSGKINASGETEIVIFPNKFKNDNPNAPDYRVYRSERPQGQGEPQPAKTAAPATKKAKAPEPKAEDEDAPF